MRNMLKKRVDEAGGVKYVAAQIGISWTTLYKWCEGTSKFSSTAVRTVCRLAKVLDCSVEDLLNDVDTDAVDLPYKKDGYKKYSDVYPERVYADR